MSDQQIEALVAELAATNAALQAEIAERRHLMEQLQQTVERLQRADQMKDTFLAVVTHELRAPTQAILGFAELLQDGLPPDQAEEALATIQFSALNQANLINNLLDFARLDAGQLSVAPRPTELPPAVRESIQVFRFATCQKQLQIEADLPADLPAVKADPERLRQILLNLVGNAVKFTDNGGWIRVRAEAAPGEVRVAVADNGIGIAREHRELIFERFGQVEAAQPRASRGTGLGLSITRWLVEAQGGRIWVDSEPGQGSTFSFTLPTA